MMKRFSICVLFATLHMLAMAQLYDKSWVVGRYCAGITFNSQKIDTFTIGKYVWSFESLAAICDFNGDFQFFTNGIGLFHADGSIVEGGDTILDKAMAEACIDGSPLPHSALILPKKGTQYYVFNLCMTDGYWQSQTKYVNRFYYAVVDMSLNGGKGKVVSKKNLLCDSLQSAGRLTACQHANGRDWWLISRGRNSNTYHKYLVTPDTIIGPIFQSIGIWQDDSYAPGQSIFSPDGTKYATCSTDRPISLLDFDRCTGMFSNPDSIVIPFDTISPGPPPSVDGGGAFGVSFSPNNRFLYVTEYTRLRQFDLASAQKDTVVFVPSYSDPNFFAFFYPMNMPNGQILICSYQGGGSYYYLIKNPNQKGKACNFVLNGLHVNTYACISICNMPNYRLGPLRGSACDTLHLGVGDSPLRAYGGIKLSPNPATDHLSISLYRYHRDARLSIYDAVGKEVYSNEQMYLDDEVDISTFKAGVYTVKVESADGMELERFVISR